MAKKTNIKIGDKKYFRTTATIGYDQNGKQIQKVFYGSSKKEANEKKLKYLNDIEQGINFDYENANVGELLKIWLFEVAKHKLAHNSFSRYEIVYRRHILKSRIANIKIGDIKPLMLQREYNEMHKDGKTENMIFSINKLLRTFFNYAILQGYILRNPCFKLIIPKDEKDNSKKEVDPFEPEEIKEIIVNTKENLRCAVILAFATGLRRGELLGLRICDVNLEDSELRVEKSLKHVKIFTDSEKYVYQTILEEPKTQSSIRTVPIPENVVSIIKKQITDEKEKHLKFGEIYTTENLLFSSEKCTFIDGRNFLKSWQRILKRANVRYRKFHNVRHTYATLLFEKDVPLKTVQTLLGHGSIKITADTYTHVMPRKRNDAVEKINHLFADIQG